MHLTSLRVQNVGPIVDKTVRFPDGLTVVTGRNGSGKSSLLEAIRWCVGGESLRSDGRREVQDSIIRNGAGEAIVELELDGVTVVRSRARGRATRLRVVTKGEVLEDAAAQLRVWDEIGAGPDSYSAITHVSQGRVTALADATDQERRDVLLSWFGESIAAWESGREDLISKKRSTRKELNRYRDRVEILTENLEEGPDPAVELPDLDGLERALDTAKRAWDTYHKMREMRVRSAARRSRFEEEISELSQRTVIQIPVPEPLEWTDEDEERLSSARAERRPLLKILSGTWKGACPIINTRCPVPDTVESQRALAAERQNRLDTEIADLERRKRAAETRLAEIRRARAHNESETAAALERVHRIESLSARMEMETAVEPTPPPHDIDGIRDALEAARAAVRNHTEIVKSRAQLEELRSRMVELEEEVAIVSAVVRAADEISGPSLVAGTRIEERTNSLLRATGLSIRLSWNEPTGKRVTICPACDVSTLTNRKTCSGCGIVRPFSTRPNLGIIMSDGRTTRDIRHASGGQRQIGCLAMRLATCPTQFIILDEVDSALDPKMAVHVARLLREATRDGLQVIAVSHSMATVDAAHAVVEME